MICLSSLPSPPVPTVTSLLLSDLPGIITPPPPSHSPTPHHVPLPPSQFLCPRARFQVTASATHFENSLGFGEYLPRGFEYAGWGPGTCCVSCTEFSQVPDFMGAPPFPVPLWNPLEFSMKNSFFTPIRPLPELFLRSLSLLSSHPHV